MKKQYRALILSAVLLVVLVATLLVVILVLPGKNASDTQTASTPQTLTVLALDPAQVQQIIVVNASGTLTAEVHSGVIGITAYGDLPYDTSKLSSLLTNSTNLTAIRKIGDTSLALADFGLDQPTATVTIRMNDGSTRQFAIGNEAPSSLGSYLLMDGTVYLVNTAYVSIFGKALADYLSLSVTEPLGAGEVLTSVQFNLEGQTIALSYVPKQVTTSQKDGQTVTETVPAFYMMDSPYVAAVAETKVTDVTYALTGFTANAVVAVKPSAEQLSEFGLAEPPYSLNAITSAGREITLYAAETADGTCYLMRKGVDVVYRTTRYLLAWMNVTPETLLGTLFPGIRAADILSISITSNSGAQYALRAADGAYTSNGKAITAAEYAAVANGILGITPATAQVPASTLAPVLTVTLGLADGRSMQLQLVPTGSGKLYPVIDGVSKPFTCEESVVQNLLALCEQADGLADAGTSGGTE